MLGHNIDTYRLHIADIERAARGPRLGTDPRDLARGRFVSRKLSAIVATLLVVGTLGSFLVA